MKQNKTYVFRLPVPSFGDVSKDVIISLFKDGRTCSPFLEEHIPIWFPKLRRVYGNQDHDHVDDENNHYDAKNFTKNGLQFMPSNQIGAGRCFNEAMATKSAKKLVYILCDIVNFPEVRIKFVPGTELMKLYSNFKIPFNERDKIFG